MYLSRIYLDPRCREARRDLSDPYQLHSTLCRAFGTSDQKCPQGTFLWRSEMATGGLDESVILVQSRILPEWENINIKGWLAQADPPLDLNDRLELKMLAPGNKFRFRLRANPSVCRNGKRLGLLRVRDQEDWIVRQGQRHGFLLPERASFDLSESPEDRIDVRITEERMLRGRQHAGNKIHVFSTLFDGFLSVIDPDRFRSALKTGIGHGKTMGLGLLSVIPLK